MRILHVIRGLLNSSGTTHIVGPLSEAQARLGAKVEVAFVDKVGGEAVLPDPELVRSHRFPLTLPFDNPGISTAFARFAHRHIADFDAVHIHAIWNFPTYWAMRSACKAGVPYMVAPQGSLDPWALAARRAGRRLYESRIERPYFCRARFMQALSARESSQIQDFGITSPVTLIPNGIAPAEFDKPAAPLSRQLGLADGTRTILFLSRLHPKKGVDTLLRAFADSGLGQRKWALIVAGEDAGSGYARELKAMARELELQKACRFIGEVGGERKVSTLKGADAFVLPTHSEGLPIAVLEALASGLPVITTPHANIPQLAETEAGLVVDDKPDAVAAALRELETNTDAMAAMAQRGRSLVERSFTWQAIAGRCMSVYNDMHRQ